MTSKIEVFLGDEHQRASILATPATTARMLLEALQQYLSQEATSQFNVTVEGSDGSAVVLAEDVPVLSCPRAAGERLVVRRKPHAGGPEVLRRLHAVSLRLQDVSASQVRVIDNLRMAALIKQSVRTEESVLENINDFVLRQCGTVEKRMAEFLALYQQPHVDPIIQQIAGLYADIVADGGLQHLSTPLDGEASVPATFPVMNRVGSHVLSLSATIDADVLDPKAASKRKKIGTVSPQYERTGFTASEKSGDRGSSSSLSSSESEESSDESLATQRPPIVPQASIMPFQNTTPKHGSLAVRTSSFPSNRHSDTTTVPVTIPAGRYRSASSLPASSATSAASSSGSGSESDSGSEMEIDAKTQAVSEGAARSRSSSESSSSSGTSEKPGRLSMGLQNLVQHLPKEVTFKPVDYLPGCTESDANPPVPATSKAPSTAKKAPSKAPALTTTSAVPKRDNATHSLNHPEETNIISQASIAAPSVAQKSEYNDSGDSDSGSSSGSEDGEEAATPVAVIPDVPQEAVVEVKKSEDHSSSSSSDTGSSSESEESEESSNPVAVNPEVPTVALVDTEKSDDVKSSSSSDSGSSSESEECEEASAPVAAIADEPASVLVEVQKAEANSSSNSSDAESSSEEAASNPASVPDAVLNVVVKSDDGSSSSSDSDSEDSSDEEGADNGVVNSMIRSLLQSKTEVEKTADTKKTAAAKPSVKISQQQRKRKAAAMLKKDAATLLSSKSDREPEKPTTDNCYVKLSQQQRKRKATAMLKQGAGSATEEPETTPIKKKVATGTRKTTRATKKV